MYDPEHQCAITQTETSCVTIDELASLCDVTTRTIRRDL
jgi:DeoR/GlpR family transcriptional regulator of sugar metabolism